MRCSPSSTREPFQRTLPNRVRYSVTMLRLLCMLFVLACGPSGTSKPAGTTSDPVDVCERVADVCRIDKAKLGVCTQDRANVGLVCASQH